MFTAKNHGPDGGSEMPVVIAGEQRFCSYFENSHGEQWLFWIDHEGRLHLRGADCSWATELAIVRLPLGSFVKLSRHKESVLGMQLLLAGVTLTVQPLAQGSEPLISLLVGPDNTMFSANREEHAWLDACVLACEHGTDQIRTLDEKAGIEFLQAALARAESRADELDEDDEEESQ